MDILKATCRIEKQTGRPCIVYRNNYKFGKASNSLSFYTREEQHSDGCQDYYRQDTRRARTDEERAACFGLVMHYAALGRRYGDQDIQIVERLPR